MTFHVRLLKENNIYAAVCLEKDVVAQGKTRDEAVERWRITMVGQIALDKKFHPGRAAAVEYASDAAFLLEGLTLPGSTPHHD